MKYTLIKTVAIYLLTAFPLLADAATQKVSIKQSVLVGDGIAKFIPEGFDAKKVPSFAIEKEPRERGILPADWILIPEFSLTDGKANASLTIPEGTSIYGGGEVTGSLLRNGKTIKLWNTDSGAYGVDNGTRLYQSHPWMMGVRKDGTAFGILFDTTWKAELSSTNEKIELRSEGEPFRVFIIDRESPQAVVRGLSELTGTMPMIPRWALGYQQSRFSYSPDSRVIEIADTFRHKRIPCDVIWMDIDYMDGYRIFTFNPQSFPNPKAVNRDLHIRGFHSAWMIDPGAKVDPNYFVYKSGTENDVWVKTADGKNFHGDAWPGAAAFPDFTCPKVNKWWRNLYKDFMAQGVDGVWNDVNEPQINDTPNKTMPEDNLHRGGGKLPAGTHLQYHNVYGFLMVKASREGILETRPERRPFILTRSNFLGGQRYAATWTGDNGSWWDHLKMSIPMSLTLGLSGQPFSGSDIGGFLFNADADLFGNWIGVGAFYPFSRGHACAGTNNKEPWAFGQEVENAARIALERRYILLPYYYTLLHEASTNGMPIMRPVFFADPKGRNVIIEKKFGAPHITKDGVTVAKEVELADAYQNTGAQLVKEVASKTGDDAGDGTTTATVLAQAIVAEGLKNVTAGASPMDIKRGIDKAVAKVVDSIKGQAETVGDNYDKIEQVASVSANNDPVIGKLIADAMRKVSKDGVITIEEAKGTDTTIGVVEGMQFDRGYLSAYFVTNTEKMECEMEKPYILIYDKKISNLKDFLPILEPAVQTGRPLLVIAEDVDSEALTTLVVNRLRSQLKICAVKAPGFGDRRKEMLEDIAVLTGGVVISEEKGLKLEQATIEMLGTADKVTVSKDNTTIVNGAGDKENIKERCEQIKAQIVSTKSDYDKEKLQERLAKLSGGVAVLYVGAASEVEMKEKKDRVDDALRATRAAIEEGIVPGGGVAYIRALDALEGFKGDNVDETTGIDIIKRAIEEPLRQIVANAGKEGAVVVQKVREGKADFGYNARTDVYENLHAAGVVDPAKVTRVALENAASIAGMFLTTECVIVEKKEDKPEMPMGAPGMGGMGGMM